MRGIVGKWCHEVAEGEIRSQGRVEAKVGSDYLVQQFDWICGDPSGQVLIPAAQVRSWTFYDTGAEMREAFEVFADHRQSPKKLQSKSQTHRGMSR